MVHKGAELLVNKIDSYLPKARNRDTRHVLTILKIRSNTHPLSFVVLYSGCHEGSTSTAFLASSPPVLIVKYVYLF